MFSVTLLPQAILVTAVIALSGCRVLKASPAPDSGFLPHASELKEMRERAPFHAIWTADPTSFADMKEHYKHIVIKPVRTEVVEAKIKKEDLPPSLEMQRIEEAREMSSYMTERFRAAIGEYPNQPVTVVDQPGPETFVVELALVEVVPTNAALNAIGTAAGLFVPGTGAVRLAATGSIAIEGIVRDGSTNKSLLEFKDRETDKNSPFSLKDYQEYAYIRQSIDEWAAQFAELTATPLDHTVEDSAPFTLNPF